MDSNISFEELGTTAYAYVTVTDASQARVTGLTLVDFTLELFNPNGSDISGSTAITVTELQDDGSPIGVYRLAVPLPASPIGAYTLTVVDPNGFDYSCMFQAYDILFGGTDDDSAQLLLNIENLDGTPATGLVIGDLTTVRIYDPSLNEISGSVVPTLQELGGGQYYLEFSIPSGSAYGDYVIDIIDAVRFPAGMQGVWMYRDLTAVLLPPPTMVSLTNDGTGDSVTIEYTTDNLSYVIYTYYNLRGTDVWTLAAETRTGSGSVQITGLTAGLTDFYGVVSQSGSPTVDQSPPSNVLRIYVSETCPSAATDNVNTAKKTMKADAVYWPPTSINFSGKSSWGTPCEIKCRWEDAKEEFLDPNGETQVSNAKLIVDRDLAVKGLLKLGTLDDVTDITNPKGEDDVWEILQALKQADFKGKKYLREVYL